MCLLCLPNAYCLLCLLALPVPIRHILLLLLLLLLLLCRILLLAVMVHNGCSSTLVAACLNQTVTWVC
jgi:hypothetical protein